MRAASFLVFIAVRGLQSAAVPPKDVGDVPDGELAVGLDGETRPTVKVMPTRQINGCFRIVPGKLWLYLAKFW